MPRGRAVEPPSPGKTTVITRETIEHPAPESAEPSIPVRALIDEFMRRLKIEELPDYAFYLYRLDDNVSTREGPKYLVRIEPQDFNQMDLTDFTESFKNWMLTKANHGKGYGGGRFFLRVNYRKTGDTHYTETYHIEGAPVPSDRETVTASPQPSAVPVPGATSDSAVANVAVKFLEQQIDEIRKKAVDPAVAAQAVMEMMQKANDKVTELILKQVHPATDPMTQLTNMLTALKTMGLIGQSAPAPVDPNAHLVSTITTLKELGLIQQPGQEKRSGLSDLKESLEMLKTMREAGMIADAGASEGPSIWPGLIAQALDKAPLIIAKVKELGSPSQPAFASMPPIAPAAAPATPGVAGTPPASAPPAPPQPMDPGVFIRAKLVEFFANGIAGDRVAEWLDLADPPTAAKLSALNAKIIIDQVIAVDPILKQMHGHANLPKFIDEFLSYWKPEDETQDKPAA